MKSQLAAWAYCDDVNERFCKNFEIHLTMENNNSWLGPSSEEKWNNFTWMGAQVIADLPFFMALFVLQDPELSKPEDTGEDIRP